MSAHDQNTEMMNSQEQRGTSAIGFSNAIQQLVDLRGASRQVPHALPPTGALVKNILARSQHRGNALLLLLIIAAEVPDGDITWSISVSRLARISKLGERGTMKNLAALRASGELVRVRQGGGLVGPSFYTFAPKFLEP